MLKFSNEERDKEGSMYRVYVFLIMYFYLYIHIQLVIFLFSTLWDFWLTYILDWHRKVVEIALYAFLGMFFPMMWRLIKMSWCPCLPLLGFWMKKLGKLLCWLNMPKIFKPQKIICTPLFQDEFYGIPNTSLDHPSDQQPKSSKTIPTQSASGCFDGSTTISYWNVRDGAWREGNLFLWEWRCIFFHYVGIVTMWDSRQHIRNPETLNSGGNLVSI